MPANASFIDRSTSLLKSWPKTVTLPLLALLLILVVLAGWLLLFKDAGGSAQASNAAGSIAMAEGRPVRVAPVEFGPLPSRLRLPGVTQATEQASLAFAHAGHLAQRHVQRGQKVSAGELLASLHNPVLMPGVAAAEAQVREIDQDMDQLQRELKRLTDLHQRALISTEELERTTARRDALRESRSQAEARLNEARDQLAEAGLRAPFAGTVASFEVEPGEFVSAGQPIMRLAGNGLLEVAVELTGQRAASLNTGQAVMIHSPDGRNSATARISEIGQASPGRPATVIARFDDHEGTIWVPGQPVHVELTSNGQDQLLLPMAAIINPGSDQSRVFKLVDGRSLRVPVQIHRADGEMVAVSGPLSAGDLVIIAGQGQLLDGEAVVVQP